MDGEKRMWRCVNYQVVEPLEAALAHSLCDPSIPPAVGPQQPPVSEGHGARGGLNGKQWFDIKSLARC